MTDDPRAVERQRYQTTQEPQRVRLGLSPSDDELPFAQAVRTKEEMARTAAAFGKKVRIRQKGSADA
jgi:hypothetical protein